tara:strand:- start:2329 stop:2439 length:111 start_codon:yes stop_codon:yes gene_type:complete
MPKNRYGGVDSGQGMAGKDGGKTDLYRAGQPMGKWL